MTKSSVVPSMNSIMSVAVTAHKLRGDSRSNDGHKAAQRHAELRQSVASNPNVG